MFTGAESNDSDAGAGVSNGGEGRQSSPTSPIDPTAKIKQLEKQLLESQNKLRDIVYTVLPKLAFCNVPHFYEKAKVSGSAVVNAVSGGGIGAISYVREMTNQLTGIFHVYEVVPGSESRNGAIVYRGARKAEGGDPCLVKEIALDNLLEPLFVEQLNIEIGLLRGITRHDCIANILHIERYPRIIHIFYDISTDLIKLKDAIKSVPKFQNDVIAYARTFRNVMSALIFCHDKKYAHLNLSLDNILVRPMNGSAVLTGFEHCRELNDGYLVKPYRSISDEARENVAVRHKSEFASPEVYWGLDCAGAKSDTFSAALVLLNIVYKNADGFPFPEDDDKQLASRPLKRYHSLPVEWAFSVQSKLKYMIDGISDMENSPLGSESLKDMLLSMTSMNYHERYESREVMKDGWIRGIMTATSNKRNGTISPSSSPQSKTSASKKLRHMAKTDRPWSHLHLSPLDRFVQASNYVHQNRMFFTSEQALMFYGLWMQSTEGPASRYGIPYKTDARERRKWDAWRKHKMKPQISAMLEYVTMLNGILDAKNNDQMDVFQQHPSVHLSHMGLSVQQAQKDPSHRPSTPGIHAVGKYRSPMHRPQTAGAEIKRLNHSRYIANSSQYGLQKVKTGLSQSAFAHLGRKGVPAQNEQVRSGEKNKQGRFLSSLGPSRLYDTSPKLNPRTKFVMEEDLFGQKASRGGSQSKRAGSSRNAPSSRMSPIKLSRNNKSNKTPGISFSDAADFRGDFTSGDGLSGW